jgi:hypothetical protein
MVLSLFMDIQRPRLIVQCAQGQIIQEYFLSLRNVTNNRVVKSVKMGHSIGGWVMSELWSCMGKMIHNQVGSIVSIGRAWLR